MLRLVGEMSKELQSKQACCLPQDCEIHPASQLMRVYVTKPTDWFET